MPFPRFNRRTQVVPVSLGPARANQAYEDSLIEQAIATREAARQQNELEAQRLAIIQSRASQYAQTRAQAQAQAAATQAASAQAQAAATQATATQATATQAAATQAPASETDALSFRQGALIRPEMNRLRREVQARLPNINFSAAPPAPRRIGVRNVVVLDHDEFGPILPTRQLEGREIHPGHTGDYEADYAFWANQVNVEERRIDALHSTYPILENYANVRVDNLRTRLEQDGIPEEVISAEVEARYNIIEARSELRTYRTVLARNSSSSTSNATQQPAPAPAPARTYGQTLAERNQAQFRNQDQLRTASMNAVPEANIRERRQTLYAVHEKYNEVRRLQGQEEEEIPEELLCPLTSEFMVDPVSEAFAEHKNTYERSNILRAVSMQDQRTQPLDPFTRVPIYPCTLVPDKERIAKMRKYEEKMYRYINNYEARLWVEGVRPQRSNLASGKKFRKLRKLRQSVKKRKSKQAKQTKQAKQATHANRRHAKLSKKYKKQYTKRVH
jgi:hypothetical protein|uniref:U-box domain-containing protein n=1 Tax=viral metagenome TaxID=1070528 RepID=A0A6C0CC58_9ZZZZ